MRSRYCDSSTDTPQELCLCGRHSSVKIRGPRYLKAASTCAHDSSLVFVTLCVGFFCSHPNPTTKSVQSSPQTALHSKPAVGTRTTYQQGQEHLLFALGDQLFCVGAQWAEGERVGQVVFDGTAFEDARLPHAAVVPAVLIEPLMLAALVGSHQLGSGSGWGIGVGGYKP